jgi:hypothetical protein
MTYPRNTCVFINCPYDANYQEIFDALLYAAVVCGFYPTSAMTPGDVGRPRMERIAAAIRNSKYSLHDLSRCRGEGDQNLARFNMPLELGIAMGQKYFSEDQANDHDWCLLVKRGSGYKQFISDLAGYDPKEYDGDVASAVKCFMSWLVVTQDASGAPVSPSQVLNTLDQFRHEVSALRDDWGEDVPWNLIVAAAEGTASQNELIPYQN